MLILFRVDSATMIGIGHLMRCLTLADALRRRGATCEFICRNHPHNSIDLVRQQGFRVYELPQAAEPTAPDDLGVGAIADAIDTCQIIERCPTIPDWLIVDHYGIDREWELKLRPYVKRIFAIDDLANRPHDCDVLLDQNDYNRGAYTQLVLPFCLCLLGSEYSIIRNEFLISTKKIRPFNNRLSKVFIYFGSSDPYGLTLLTINSLLDKDLINLEVDIIVSKDNSFFDQIKNIADDKNYNLYTFHENICDLMNLADLGIGAGGTTAKERIATGLPSIVVSLGLDQERNCIHLSKSEKIYYLGSYLSVDTNQMRDAIIKLKNNPDQLFRMSLNCINSYIVDGVSKICRVLLKDK
ncbi:UDP-2,4-diacetamido-2,4,6-trideoxy-beta-L-altropyranose hydrolase [Parathermosynechococcus lividus]